MRINDFTPDTSIFEKMNGTSENYDNGGTNDFVSILKSKLDGVNEDQIQADSSIENFIEGNTTDIHNVMMDSEQAKMSLQLAVQIRNKLVDAYQELNRTQI